MARFAPGADVSVVYTASDELNEHGYAIVREDYPWVRWGEERAQGGFKEATLEFARDAGSRLAFLVDDIVFTHELDLDAAGLQALDEDPRVLCCSLRLDPNKDYCYALDAPMEPPALSPEMTFEWRGRFGDWGYPMSADGHVFRTEQIVPLLERLDYFNPNSLEEQLSQNPLDLPLMACVDPSTIVNVPDNRVQDTAPNRHAGNDAQRLAVAFVSGRRLDLAPFEGLVTREVHHVMPLEFEASDQPQPVALDSRTYAVAADLGEVAAAPELLYAYAQTFTATDDVTLVLYGAATADEIAERAQPVLAAAGIDGPGAPDVLAVPGSGAEAAVAARATATLSRHGGTLGNVPSFDAHTLGQLRETLFGAQTPPLDKHERFRWELDRYRALPGGEGVSDADLNPQLEDRTPTNPYDEHYFHQDVWAARRVAEYKPGRHVDVGSRVDLVGFLTAICPVAFVDIRSLPVQIEDFESIVGSILDLPFPDRSLESVSCLHVAEHIGLGRYGDPLDPHGTVKAAAELQRVLAPGGHLLFSGPVGRKRTCFNAHRVHDVFEVMEKFFPELELVEFSGVDDRGVFRRHRRLDELAGCEYACGMFHFVRPPEEPVQLPAITHSTTLSSPDRPAAPVIEPPTPEAKRDYLLGLLRHRGNRVFVESGTYLGDTTAFLRPYVARIITVEVEPKLYADAEARFAGDPQIDVLFGDGQELIPRAVEGLAEPAFIWLDGHFSGGVTGMGEQVEPALAILDTFASMQLPEGTTVLVDDLRMFGCEPAPWPSLDGLVNSARRAFPNARIYTGLDSLVIEG